MHTLLRRDGDVLLLLRSVEHDLAFVIGEVAPGHVGAHPELAGDGRLHVEPEHVPRHHRALVEGLVGVGDERVVVDGPYDAGPRTRRARAARVEGEILGAGSVDLRAAHRAEERPFGSDVDRRGHVVAVGTSMRRQAREHQPQHVEQLTRRTKRRAHSRWRRSLSQCERCRYVFDGIDFRARRLRHPSSGVGRQCLDVAPRPLRVQHPECQRRLTRPGHSRDPHQRAQRDVDVEVGQVVHPSPAHGDLIRLCTAAHGGGHMLDGTAHPPEPIHARPYRHAADAGDQQSTDPTAWARYFGQ